MTERRIDPYTGRSVILAPGRRGIGAVRAGGLPELRDARCPFCPGHEADAEPTVAAWPSEGPWRARIIGNKFPLARLDAEADGGIFGIHEVGIDAREHDVDLADLDDTHLSSMLGLYRDRARALAAQPGIATVVIFRNRGRRAGSSQPHPHTQLVALGHVPDDIARREVRAREHRREHGLSIHDAELARERRDGRVLAEREEAILVCPYAPSRSHEMRVLPTVATSHLTSSSDAQLKAVAELLGDAMRRLRTLGIEDHNILVRQTSLRATSRDSSWHIEILPRTGGDAGYELATGEMIVLVPPEDAARALREAVD